MCVCELLTADGISGCVVGVSRRQLSAHLGKAGVHFDFPQVQPAAMSSSDDASDSRLPSPESQYCGSSSRDTREGQAVNKANAVRVIEDGTDGRRGCGPQRPLAKDVAANSTTPPATHMTERRWLHVSGDDKCTSIRSGSNVIAVLTTAGELLD